MFAVDYIKWKLLLLKRKIISSFITLLSIKRAEVVRNRKAHITPFSMKTICGHAIFDRYVRSYNRNRSIINGIINLRAITLDLGGRAKFHRDIKVVNGFQFYGPIPQSRVIKIFGATGREPPQTVSIAAGQLLSIVLLVPTPSNYQYVKTVADASRHSYQLLNQLFTTTSTTRRLHTKYRDWNLERQI